jgi:hypothetical protein
MRKTASWVISKGTHIVCDRLFVADYLSTRNYEVECTIVSGPRKGDKVYASCLVTGEPGIKKTLRVNELFAKALK